MLLKREGLGCTKQGLAGDRINRRCQTCLGSDTILLET